MTTERRRAPRQPLTASAEVIELQTNTRLKARTLGMSLVGCYLDRANPLPVGVEVSVQILHNDAAFTALGVIVNCAQNMPRRPYSGWQLSRRGTQLSQRLILVTHHCRAEGV